MKDFYSQKGGGDKEVIKAEKRIGYCQVIFLRGLSGVSQAGCLGSVEKEIAC